MGPVSHNFDNRKAPSYNAPISALYADCLYHLQPFVRHLRAFYIESLLTLIASFILA